MMVHPGGNLFGIPKLDLVVMDVHTRGAESVTNSRYPPLNGLLVVATGAEHDVASIGLKDRTNHTLDCPSFGQNIPASRSGGYIASL